MWGCSYHRGVKLSVKSNVNAIIRSDMCDAFGGESEPQRCEGLLSNVLMIVGGEAGGGCRRGAAVVCVQYRSVIVCQE